MPWDVADFCQAGADEYIAGDLDAMAARYAIPLVVYLPEGVSVRLTRADLIAALRLRRERAIEGGTVKIRATVIVIDSMKEGRLPLMVEWSFRDAANREIARSRLRYYCRQGGDGRLVIELLEALRFGFPDP